MSRLSRKVARRQFLAGAGTMLAIPFLQSLLPRRAWAAVARAEQAAGVPKRLVLAHMPCGIIINSWVPSQTGATYTMSPTLSPLTALQKNVLVLSNMQNDAAVNSPDRAGQGLHARGLGTVFTGANLQLDVGKPRAATSMDQLYAQSIAGQTAVNSLQLGLKVAQGDCDDGYACQTMQSISWADANTPVVDQEDPQQIFDKYFANVGTSSDAAAQDYLRAKRKSVLDGVLAQATTLQTKLSADDARKLDQYFTSVRALEQQFSGVSAAACNAGTRPAATQTTDFQARAAAMMDLMALAFQCDLTRVITFNFGAGHCDHYYNFLQGINDTHHSLSHHNGDAGKIAQLATIDQWQISVLARFWKGLAAVPVADGTLLDHSVSLVTSEVANGSAHTYTDLGVVVVGGGGGFISSGRHVRAGQGETFGNLTELQLAILQGLGTNVTSFGDFKVTRAMTLTA